MVFKVQTEDPLDPSVEADAEDEPDGTNLTASAQVDLVVELDWMTTLACPEKS